MGHGRAHTTRVRAHRDAKCVGAFRGGASTSARLAANTDAQGGQLATQPDTGAIKVLLDLLLDDLLANGTADTQAMVMATCAASFGHAGMLVQ